MSPTMTFWLGVLASAFMTAAGVAWGNWHDRRLSAREGSLDRPRLAILLKGIPPVGSLEQTVTYVVQEPPGVPARGLIDLTVQNAGRRAAESVVAQLTYPRAVSLPDEAYAVIEHDLLPGREVRRETIGDFSTLSVYWPHVAPGVPVAFAQEFNLGATTVPLSLENVVTADGQSLSISGVAELAWRANVQLSSKEGLWPGSSIVIRVAIGVSLQEVARKIAEQTHTLELRQSGLEGSRGLRRARSALRYWRIRRSRVTSHFLVEPHLNPVLSEAGDVTRFEEDLGRAEWYAMVPIRGGWTLVPASAGTLQRHHSEARAARP